MVLPMELTDGIDVLSCMSENKTDSLVVEKERAATAPSSPIQHSLPFSSIDIV